MTTILGGESLKALPVLLQSPLGDSGFDRHRVAPVAEEAFSRFLRGKPSITTYYGAATGEGSIPLNPSSGMFDGHL